MNANAYKTVSFNSHRLTFSYKVGNTWNSIAKEFH